MKNSLLITSLMVGVAFSGSAVAAGCPDGVCPAKYTCACDDAGNLREKTRVRGEETTIEAFDAAGHQTSYTVYDSADAVANNTPTIQLVYTYDAAGHRTSDTTYDSADAVANSRPDYQAIYTYDAAGHQTSSTFYNSADAITNNRPDSQTVNTYDAAGHQTSSTSYNSADAITNNRPDSQTVNTYDAAGHQTSQTTYNSADAVANNTPTSQTSYTNDALITQRCSATSCITTANGREISRTNYSNGVPSQRSDHTYDAQGQVTSEIRYKSSQSITDESPDMQIMTLRNDSGQVTSFTIYGKNHVPIGAIVYTYDENGNKIYETEYGAGAAYLDEPDPNFPFDPNKPLYQRRYPIGQNYFLKDDCSKKSCQDYPWTEPQVPCTLGHIPGCIGDGVGVEVFPINYSTIDCSGSGYVSGCTGYREGADTIYNNPQIVCATGNISGCVGDTVQLADGTSAMMQNGQIFNQFSDGSTTLYNADGTIKGYKGKRIYTIEEATKVSGERNTLRIRYK